MAGYEGMPEAWAQGIFGILWLLASLVLQVAPASPAVKEEGHDSGASHSGRTPACGKVFFGLCLAVAGALLLMNNLGTLPFNVDWRFWPVFLMVLAGARMVERGILRTGPHILLMVALFLLAVSFERDDLLERWWPVAIVWGGILLTLKAVFQKPKQAPCPSEDQIKRQP